MVAKFKNCFANQTHSTFPLRFMNLLSVQSWRWKPGIFACDFSCPHHNMPAGMTALPGMYAGSGRLLVPIMWRCSLSP